LRARRKKLIRDLKEARKIADEHKCLQALKIAFSQKGLRHDRLHTVLKEAAEQTIPPYIDLLWPNRNVTIELVPGDSSIRFQLVRKGQKVATNQRALSGGEGHKAGLASLFGLRDLAEMYTGYKSNILILDEPFGNMDNLGMKGMLRVLESLKDRFSSIFVICHLPETLLQHFGDQVWWAVRENNESVLYRENVPRRYLKASRQYAKSLAV
jgi:DNA repair exonuclease SbcCD ATPase subunit